MNDRLREALEAGRGEIEAAVREAEEELAALATRREELEELIARAKAALGSESPARQMTLHEAMKTILEERDDRSMSVRDLAAEVTQRGLYRKRDGSPVEVNQVHARAKNYDKLFEKDGSRVTLLEVED
jgi:chorismate mutase